MCVCLGMRVYVFVYLCVCVCVCVCVCAASCVSSKAWSLIETALRHGDTSADWKTGFRRSHHAETQIIIQFMPRAFGHKQSLYRKSLHAKYRGRDQDCHVK